MSSSFQPGKHSSSLHSRIWIFWIPQIGGIKQCFCFSDWLLTFSNMSSGQSILLKMMIFGIRNGGDFASKFYSFLLSLYYSLTYHHVLLYTTFLPLSTTAWEYSTSGNSESSECHKIYSLIPSTHSDCIPVCHTSLI